jgi:hypothetical protein
MTAEYSDLQVDDAEHALGYSTKEHLYGGSAQPVSNVSDVTCYEQAHFEPVSQKRICGLPVKTFWITTAIITVVIVAAAVGGGVGGSVLSKSNSMAAASTVSTQSINATYAPTTTTSSSTGPITSAALNTVALTTTSLIGPSTTLLSDCPSSNNTLYNIDLGSDNMLFRKICSAAYLNTNGIDAVVNTPTNSLDVCISLCADYNVQNQTEIANGIQNVCNAVCWRGTFTDDDYPGYCFGYTTQNSSQSFVVTNDTRCDSAAWINQSF